MRSTQSVRRGQCLANPGSFWGQHDFETSVALGIPTKVDRELTPQLNRRIAGEILLNTPLRPPNVEHLAQVSRRPGGCHRVSVDHNNAVLRRSVPQGHARWTVHGQGAMSD